MSSRARYHAPFLFSAALFGLLIWMALPRIIVVIDDDFWYLKSVVETYQRGRPWTAEWLTPWGASTSLLVAALYKISGSFSFGVHASLALAGTLTYLGMSCYLDCCGFTRRRSMMVSLLLLGTPTIFFMFLMFTSVALYLACLWWCLYFAIKRQWWCFFLVWCVAISSRQSAVVWMAIPVWHGVILWFKGEHLRQPQPQIWKPIAVVTGGILMVLLLKLGMNETHGQRVVMDTVRANLGFGRLALPFSLGFLSIFAGAGLAGLLQFKGYSHKCLTMHRCMIFVLMTSAGVPASLWAKGQLVTTHAAYGGWMSTAGFVLWGVLAAAGYAWSPPRPQIGMLLAAVGSILLVSLYNGIFDYYFVDAFLLSFAAALTPRQHKTEEETLKLPWRAVAMFVLIFVVQGVWNFRGYVKMKYAQDRYASLIELAERNVRSGRLKVNETGFAGFGYSGWKLEDHFRSHDGRNSNSIAGFLEYTRPWYWNGEYGTGVVTEYPRSFKRCKEWLPSHNSKSLAANKQAEILDQLNSGLLWIFNATYTLKKVHSEKPNTTLDSYKDFVFPLNDREWNQLLNAIK